MSDSHPTDLRPEGTGYYRPDGLLMIEIAPHQFVNEASARALGLIARASRYAHANELH